MSDAAGEEHRGIIELKVFPSKEVTRTSPPLNYSFLPSSQQTIKKEDGKKFWTLPSAVTTYDASYSIPYTLPPTYHLTTSTTPLETVTIYYHSPGTLDILEQIAEDGEDAIEHEEDTDKEENIITTIKEEKETKTNTKNNRKAGKRKWKTKQKGPILIDLINNTVTEMTSKKQTKPILHHVE